MKHMITLYMKCSMSGNVACNFKKIPTLTQDLSRRCIETGGGECVHVPS